MTNNNFFTSILITATVTAFLTYLLTRSGPVANPRDVVPSAFYLGVGVIFPSVREKEIFKVLFRPLAKYVKDNEPGTISYEVLESDKDENRILILERYVNKDYYLTIHRSSKEFLSFRGEFQKMIDAGAKVDGQSYLETGIGYI